MNLKVYPMIVVSKSLKNEKRNNMTTEEFAYLRRFFFLIAKSKKVSVFMKKWVLLNFVTQNEFLYLLISPQDKLLHFQYNHSFIINLKKKTRCKITNDK